MVGKKKKNEDQRYSSGGKALVLHVANQGLILSISYDP